jgi:hypothetical protein
MEGTCLCGAIRITIPETNIVDACHCGMCRRWSGGPLMVVKGGTDIQIEGRTDALKSYQSSEWAERAFCSECGTHLFYKFLPKNEYFLPVGLFQEQTEFKFTTQIYIDSKPSFYEFANSTTKMTEAEFLAHFS